MGYAELRFAEMVRELRESNRLLAKLVKSTESIDRNLQIEISPLWPSEQSVTNRQKTIDLANQEDEERKRSGYESGREAEEDYQETLDTLGENWQDKE